MTKRCIIVGGGHAAAQLSASLRQEGWSGEIVVVSNEACLPYHRPPLSKTFLAGDKASDDLLIRPPEFYDKHAIQFLHGTVSAIDREARRLTLDDSQTIAYDKLAFCAGARARKLDLPGSELAGVHYLRSMVDVEGIRSDIGENKKAVIIGGGYIGLEAAALLNSLGLSVTVLEMAPRVLQRVTAPELSEFYTRVHREEGIAIHDSVSIKRIKGTQRAEQVICSDGREFPADVVIVGVGIEPNIELARAAGLDVREGIVIDEHCLTTDENIVAAGDCTVHFNPLYERWMRLESVPNANEQAKVAAATLCGKHKVYASLPWFWSDQYDMKLQIAGLSQGYDQVLFRGDRMSGRSFAAFYFRSGRLICADCVNRPQEFLLSKRIIAGKLDVDQERLMDENIPVKDILQG